MIKIKDRNSDLLKIEKKSYKKIDIYYIGFIIIKDLNYVNSHSVNPLHFIINKADEYIEKGNGNKYLTLISNDKNKEVLIKYTEVLDKIKNLIEKINSRPSNFDDKYMKIKFNLDDDLPMGKILSRHNMTIVVRSVFQENNKYYP